MKKYCVIVLYAYSLKYKKNLSQIRGVYILENHIYYIKKLPVTEPGAKKNKIRSKLLLLVHVLYRYSISKPIKKHLLNASTLKRLLLICSN